MSPRQTNHKHEPEPEHEPEHELEPCYQCANPQSLSLPTPPCLAIPTLAQQIQPMMQYVNPQMTLLYGLTPPGFTPVNAQAKQSSSNSAQVEPLIRSKSAGKKTPQPLHGSALAPKPPRIQSTNAHKDSTLLGSALAPKPPGIQSMNANKTPTPPLHGSALNTAQEQPWIQCAPAPAPAPAPASTPTPTPTPHYGLAPNPEETVVRSSGESSSAKKIKCNKESNKHTARFRYRPYPIHEKPKHVVPAPFDLNEIYQGKPLSMERTDPPVLEARRENTPAGDGSLPLVLDARSGKMPAGDIPGSSSVPMFPGEKENLDLSLRL